MKKTIKKKIKKVSKKKAIKPKSAKGGSAKPIGSVTHYYSGLGVAIVKFKKPVKVGVSVAFRGATTDFVQLLDSMQYDHKSIKLAPKGKEVGIKVSDRVREDDGVYLV